jgi:hypothetical protein
MPTLEELIAQVNTARPRPEAPEPDPSQLLDREWPPFDPPAALPRRLRLTVEWLWEALWGEMPYQPDAFDLARGAAEHDTRFPKSQEARYRRENPDWLAETVAFYVECWSDHRWRRVEQLLGANASREAGWSATDLRRIAWLRQHEEAIRPVLEQAKAEHFRRYGIGSFWYRPGADGKVAEWKRKEWPPEADRWKVPPELCTRWTWPEDRAQLG